jgi:probable F420-dependent oxidoreductase
VTSREASLGEAVGEQPIEIALGIGGTLADVTALARAAERRGFGSVWVAELTRSATVQAATAIAATTDITVGTAITLAFPRSPTVTAMEAWDLDEASGGRFVLGLGSQVRRVMEARFSVGFDHPAGRMADYAGAIRAVWAANRGEPVTHEGPFYRVTMPTFHGPAQAGRRDVPILFAAVGPVMSRTAGTAADGLLAHPLASPRYLGEIVVPAVAEGLRRADRPGDACPINGSPVVSIASDAGAARDAARLQLAFYATTRTYAPILDLHGRLGIQGDLRRAFVRRDHARMIELIDDELLDAIAVAGSPDEGADRLRRWIGDAVAAGARPNRVILTAPWYAQEPAAQREMAERIAEVFGR